MITQVGCYGKIAQQRAMPSHGAWQRLLETLHVWAERYRSRGELLGWTEREFNDVVYSRAEVAREAGKPFWRA